MAIQVSGNTVINDQRELGAGLLSAYDVVTAGGSTTIANRTVYYVTTDSQTITLPASPSAGNEVVIMVGNYTGVVIASNGQRIMGLLQDMGIDLPYASMRLIYVDATRGWIIC